MQHNQHNRRYYRRAVIAAACVILLALVFGLDKTRVPVAYASIIHVDSIADPSDPGKCTLRDAITAANTNTQSGGCPAGSPYPAVDTITVGFSRIYCLLNPCTIVLSAPLPAVTEDVIIHGASSFMTISGANLYRVFNLQAVNVTVSNLRIVNGNAMGACPGLCYGGAINTSSSDTTLIVY